MTFEARQLLLLLTNALPPRKVYIAANGSGWYITHGGGKANAETVRELIDGNHIHSCYSDCPRDMYYVGKTLDVKATFEERKKHRRKKNALRIYTDGTREPR